ncbi:uncharacterized protein LY89DRAFT_740094 [Mollisia scopiformis]|uniref:Uncharacterized protein n=1 Tax=Mollisia scopiformis TaxID=149040 RepID=A0A132BD68_MOLSC|nr:uncharacterized protein LY89DRAFT_740094 [Mollisia scopiformis]KUJ10372.1 hypothetical protein LY89DRAFT_740094 [Mollisia scopiformis]
MVLLAIATLALSVSALPVNPHVENLTARKNAYVDNVTSRSAKNAYVDNVTTRSAKNGYVDNVTARSNVDADTVTARSNAYVDDVYFLRRFT